MTPLRRWTIGALMLLAAGGATDGWAQTTARPHKLEIQLHRAETAWKSGASLLEAKARLDRVLDKLPDDLEARTLRAEVLLDLNRPEEALVDARRAVALAPSSGQAYLLLTEAARRSSHLDLARRALQQAARKLGENAARHVRLSWNAVLLGKPALAESLAREALALDETEAAAYYQLARVFLRQEQPDQAAAALARGLESGIAAPSFIRGDRVLRRVAEHPRLRRWME